MKVLFYETKSYDRDSFSEALPKFPDVKVDFIDANLSPMTAGLARGYDAVCAFVNADVSAMTLEVLAGFGVKMVLMRCAGFDAVNVPMAKELGMTVTRVPAYSPEAIAEHAMGLALCANRRIHKGYIRVRENNFSLEGLVGVTLHGKTAGIIGTGRIGAALARICKGFGMTVLGTDLYPNQNLIEEGCIDEYVDYDDAATVELQKAILSLPTKQQLAFNMRYYDGLEYDEIARILDSSESSVKANYSIAKQKIIKYMNLDNRD